MHNKHDTLINFLIRFKVSCGFRNVLNLSHNNFVFFFELTTTTLTHGHTASHFSTALSLSDGWWLIDCGRWIYADIARVLLLEKKIARNFYDVHNCLDWWVLQLFQTCFFLLFTAFLFHFTLSSSISHLRIPNAKFRTLHNGILISLFCFFN